MRNYESGLDRRRLRAWPTQSPQHAKPTASLISSDRDFADDDQRQQMTFIWCFRGTLKTREHHMYAYGY